MATTVFRVNRRAPVLIKPSKSTPLEVKQVSDIDDQHGLRTLIPLFVIYPYHPSMLEKDPPKVIKEALSEVLVSYYPFAGRLREGRHGKLEVECTGEGALFIEADAEVSLQQLSDQLRPPFPCFDELLFAVPRSNGIINCPLIMLQLTRLSCGGVILAVRSNHVMADGAGLVQFLSAMAELARGALAPSIKPLWMRELLSARNPPRVTCIHHEYEDAPGDQVKIPVSMMTHRSFFYKLADISAVRNSLPPNVRRCSSNFDILTACLWRSRTIALQQNPSDEMKIICIVDARRKFNPPIPPGFYGNCIASPTEVATAGELSEKPIEFAIERVRKAKSQATEEYMRSVADLMVMKGRPRFTTVRTFAVSDMTRSGLDELDLGWGKAVYAGPAKGNVVSFQVPSKNKRGEDGILVTLYLPIPAMERFVREMGSWFADEGTLPRPKL